MLDLIGQALVSNNFLFERLDGSKSSTQRLQALRRFREDPHCIVLLASLGSAAVG